MRDLFKVGPDQGERDVRLWRQLLIHADAPLLVLKGPEHRCELVNEAFVRLVHRRNEEVLVGRPVREALPELEGHGVFEMLDEVYSTGVAHTGREERRLLLDTATGEARESYFDVICKPILGEDGRPIGLMAEGHDVSEYVLARKRAQAREDALTLEWEHLAEMYRTAPVGFAMYEPKGFRMIHVNEKFTEMLNIPAERMMGRSVLDFAGEIDGVRQRFECVAAGGRVDNVVIEGELKSQPGVYRCWLVNYTPLLDGHGMVRAIW